MNSYQNNSKALNEKVYYFYLPQSFMSMVKCSQLSPVVKFSINAVMVILVQIQIFLLPKNETVNYAVAESFNNLDKDLILFVSGKYFQGELTLGTKLCFST